MTENDELKNIVAFCVLMEHEDGILTKSPAYIMEKFKRYCKSDRDEYFWGLDTGNIGILMKWIGKWLGGKELLKDAIKFNTGEEIKG